MTTSNTDFQQFIETDSSRVPAPPLVTDESGSSMVPETCQ